MNFGVHECVWMGGALKYRSLKIYLITIIKITIVLNNFYYLIKTYK